MRNISECGLRTVKSEGQCMSQTIGIDGVLASKTDNKSPSETRSLQELAELSGLYGTIGRFAHQFSALNQLASSSSSASETHLTQFCPDARVKNRADDLQRPAMMILLPSALCACVCVWPNLLSATWQRSPPAATVITSVSMTVGAV